MKRALLITAIATGLGLAGFSLWTSLRVESAHREWVSLMESRPEVRVTETHFQRGWLESIGQTRFEVRGSAGEVFRAPLVWAGRTDVRKRVGFLVRQRIDHGPLGLLAWFQEGAVGSPYLAVVDGSIELDQEAQSELSGVFGRLPSMRVRLPVRASGEADAQLSMAAGALRPRDVEPGKAPRWLGRFDGLNGRLRLTPSGAALHLTSPGLELVGEELTVKAQGWTVDIDLGRLDAPGGTTSQHQLARLQVEVGLVAATDAAASDAHPRTLLAVEEASWTVGGEPDEGHLKGSAGLLHWNLLELATPELEANWPRPLADEEQAAQGLFGFLREIEITRLDGRLDEGAFEAQGTLIFPDPHGDQAAAQIGPGPEETSWVHGALQVAVPEAFATRLLADQQERLEAWIGQGQVAVMDGVLRTRLQWDDAGWRANGQAIETEGWLERLAPEPQLARPAESLSEPEDVADAAPLAEEPRPEAAMADETPGDAGGPEAVAEAAPPLPTIFDEKPAEAAAPADETEPALPAAPAP